MKPLVRFLFYFLPLSLIIISCKPKTDNVKISITVRDTSVHEFKLKLFTTFSEILITETKLDSLGNGIVQFPIEKSSFYNYQMGENYGSLYLEKGDDFTLTLNPKKQGSQITFVGKGSEANQYLYSAQLINRNYEERNGKSLCDLDFQDFSKRIDSLNNAFSDFHESYFASTNQTKEITNLLYKSNKLRVLEVKLNYILAHPLDIGNKEFVPRNLQNLSKEIPYDNDLMNSGMSTYKAVLAYHLTLSITNPIYSKYKSDTISFVKAITDSVKKRNYPTAVNEFMYARILSEGLASRGLTKDVRNGFNDFKKLYGKSIYLPELETNYRKWQAIEPGNIAPIIKGTSPNGNIFYSTYLKGKVIYIDVWATWCGPCREQFPYAKGLEEKFKNNNRVAFLFVSVDNNKQAWKNMIKSDLVPKGIHILDEDQTVWKDYLLWGVPRYILIDQEGKIVDANAPQPSSGKVESLVNKLLQPSQTL